MAYVDRGTVKFSDKVKNVRAQGARAVIIGNNDPADDKTLGFTLGNPATWPPVTAIPSTSVADIKAQLGRPVKVGIHGSDYAYSSGTSMATPHASAVAALVWSANPKLKNQQVRDILEASAKDLQDPDVPDSGPGSTSSSATAWCRPRRPWTWRSSPPTTSRRPSGPRERSRLRTGAPAPESPEGLAAQPWSWASMTFTNSSSACAPTSGVSLMKKVGVPATPRALASIQSAST